MLIIILNTIINLMWLDTSITWISLWKKETFNVRHVPSSGYSRAIVIFWGCVYTNEYPLSPLAETWHSQSLCTIVHKCVRIKRIINDVHVCWQRVAEGARNRLNRPQKRWTRFLKYMVNMARGWQWQCQVTSSDPLFTHE